MNLRELTIPELLRLQAAAIEELRAREVVRTANNPIGDYTEWLVSTALGLTLTGNSSAGYDAISRTGIRIQIKGRRVTAKNPSQQLSAIRNLDEKDFDELVAVIFNDDFEIVEAVAIPHEVVGEYSTYRKHVNAHILHIREKLLEDSRIRSIKTELNAANHSLQTRRPDGTQP